MEDASHGRLDGMVVEIDGFGVVCAARGAEWLSGSEQGFDGFVAQDRLQTSVALKILNLATAHLL